MKQDVIVAWARSRDILRDVKGTGRGGHRASATRRCDESTILTGEETDPNYEANRIRELIE